MIYNQSKPLQPLKVRKETFSTVTRYSTRYAFPLFVTLFVAFVAVYATSLMLFSGHYIWSPSIKHNALKEETGTKSNKMYVRLEKRTSDYNEPYEKYLEAMDRGYY